MKQLIFIHGGEVFKSKEEFLKTLRKWEYNPHKDISKKWNKRIAEELGESFDVFTPTMPCKQNADYQAWEIWFEKVLEYINSEVVFVGYSLGGTFLLKFISENNLNLQIDKLVLLAPAVLSTKEQSLENFEPNKNLINSIEGKVKQIHILHSKDDPVVPFSDSIFLQKLLPNAKLHIFNDKKHFFDERFDEFFEVLKI